MYKFTGFTQSANNALNYSIEAAENFGHTYIGSEHLLAGIVREDNGSATTLLISKGVTVQKVEQSLKNNIGIGIPTVLTPNDFTPRAKHIIELSVSIANSQNAGYVGTEHILCALLGEEDCSACGILYEMGLSSSLILDEMNNGERSCFSSGSSRK